MKIGVPSPLLVTALLQQPAGRPLHDPPSEGGTFGFDELGVFGLRRGQPAGRLVEQPRTPRCHEPAPRSAEVGKMREPPAPLAPPTDPASPKPSRSRPGHAPALTGPVEKGTAPELKLNGSAGCEPPENAFAGEMEEISGPERNAAPPRRSETPRAAHSLLLAVNDGQARISAGAPTLDAEGRALLRRLVRELLAGHRLTLADFHLNGVPLEADFIAMTGGFHGPRSR